jgi:zinc protease
MDELTLDDVNGAIKRHLQTADLKIAIVTGDAPGLAAALTGGAPTPISYDTPKPKEITDEDREIASFPLAIAVDRVTILPVEEAFER